MLYGIAASKGLDKKTFMIVDPKSTVKHELNKYPNHKGDCAEEWGNEGITR